MRQNGHLTIQQRPLGQNSGIQKEEETRDFQKCDGKTTSKKKEAYLEKKLPKQRKMTKKGKLFAEHC